MLAFFSPPEKISTNTYKFLMTFLSHLPKQIKILRLPKNSRQLFRPFLSCAAPFFSSFVRIYQKCHLLNVNLTIFDANFNIFSEVPPLWKCHLGRLTPSAPLGTPLGRGQNWSKIA